MNASSRQRVVIAVVVLVVMTAAGGAAVSPRPAAAADDALHRRVASELAEFTDWAARHGVRGFIGEVGWPDDKKGDAAHWNALAEEWFGAVDAAGMGAVVWATGEGWPDDYQLDIYRDAADPPGVDTPNTQAEVLERHLSTSGYMRGVDAATATFCEASTEPYSSFSNRDPVAGYCHHEHPSTFEFLAGRGIDLVKIEIRWERLQRRLGGDLHDVQTAKLKRTIDAARAAGLRVIVNIHNFGAYYRWNGERGERLALGSRRLPIRAFVDLWNRLSDELSDDPGVFYGLMCEPVEMPRRGDLRPAEVWERASQAVVDALRARGDDKLLFVSGYRYSAVQGWAQRHPVPWISDPADNFVYEAHHYWDSDSSGRYRLSYEKEVANAADQGY